MSECGYFRNIKKILKLDKLSFFFFLSWDDFNFLSMGLLLIHSRMIFACHIWGFYVSILNMNEYIFKLLLKVKCIEKYDHRLFFLYGFSWDPFFLRLEYENILPKFCFWSQKHMYGICDSLCTCTYVCRFKGSAILEGNVQIL